MDTVEANVRTLLRDVDPAAYARDPEEVRAVIIRKTIEFGVGIFSPTEQDVAIVPIVGTGVAVIPLLTTNDVDAVLNVWDTDTKLVLRRIHQDDAQWMTLNQSSGPPSFYHLYLVNGAVTIRVLPIPVAAVNLTARVRYSAPLDAGGLIQVSDVLQLAIETASAAEIYAGLPDTERVRLKISPDIAKGWMASSLALQGKEKDRMSRLTRTSHIAAGVP